MRRTKEKSQFPDTAGLIKFLALGYNFRKFFRGRIMVEWSGQSIVPLRFSYKFFSGVGYEN